MSKVSLDLKQFQHVKSDDNCTTLRHKDGHELTIAHKALNPKFQEQLKALHAFADGGEAKPTGRPNVAPDSHPEKYDQTMSNGWDNLKNAFKAEGGEMEAPQSQPDKTQDDQQDLMKMTPDQASQAGKLFLGSVPGEDPKAIMAELQPIIAKYGSKVFDLLGNIGQDAAQSATKIVPDAGFGKIVQAQGPAQALGKVIMKADGGDVQPEGAPQEEQSNAPEPDQGSQPQEQAAPAPDQGSLGTQTQLQSDPNMMAQADQAAQQPAPPVPPQTAQTMEQPPVDPITQYKNDVQNEIHQEGLAYQADRTNGHIDAPSAEKMFHDKSTLGKARTAFALIVGGLGSGLTGQPNQAVQIIQNQLDRDFKAQLQSADNAQNYFRLNQQNLANQSNIKMTNTERNIKAAANARIQMNWDALNNLTAENAKLPEGSPARRNGDAVLAMLNDQVQKGNFSIGAQAATAAAQAKLLGLSGAPGQGGGTNVTAMKVLGGDKGRTMADEIENKTISGIPEVAGQKAARPITEQARNTITAMKTLDDKTKDLFNFINQHKGMDLKRLDPKVRAVAQQKLEEVKNFYNSSIQGGALTEGRLGWYDKQFGKGAPTDVLPQLMGQTDKFKEISDSNHTRMNTQLQSMGFNPKNTKSGAAQAQDAAAQQKQAAAPQEETRMVNGKAAVFNPSTKQFIRWK